MNSRLPARCARNNENGMSGPLSSNSIAVSSGVRNLPLSRANLSVLTEGSPPTPFAPPSIRPHQLHLAHPEGIRQLVEGDDGRVAAALFELADILLAEAGCARRVAPGSGPPPCGGARRCGRRACACPCEKRWRRARREFLQPVICMTPQPTRRFPTTGAEIPGDQVGHCRDNAGSGDFLFKSARVLTMVADAEAETVEESTQPARSCFRTGRHCSADFGDYKPPPSLAGTRRLTESQIRALLEARYKRSAAFGSRSSTRAGAYCSCSSVPISKDRPSPDGAARDGGACRDDDE